LFISLFSLSHPLASPYQQQVSLRLAISDKHWLCASMYDEVFWDALTKAVASDDLLEVQRLLAANAGDAYVMTGMMWPSLAALMAASCGHVLMPEWLLDHGGASIEAVTEQGKTIWDYVLLLKFESGAATGCSFDKADGPIVTRAPAVSARWGAASGTAPCLPRAATSPP
jgi:hypothetical protein